MTRIVRGLYAIPLVFLAVFFFYPLGAIFDVSFNVDGQFDISGFQRIASTPYYRDTLWFTVWQAVVSTVLTLALALPGAFLVIRYRFRGKALLLALATLPFVLPTVVVAAAFSALLGNNGLLNHGLMQVMGLESPPLQLERSLTAIFIAHVFYNYAVALRMIAGYWMNQSPRMEEAARVLGCGGWRLWWRVRLPLLRPVILSAGVLVFIFTFTSFGVILILGGLRYATLEVEIYQQAVNLFNLPMAAALSIVQIVVMFALMVVYTRLQKQTPLDLQAVGHVARYARTRGERLFVAVNVSLISLLLFSPLLALVWRSLTVGAGAGNYANLWQNPRGSVLFVPPVTAIGNSLVFAVITTVLAGGLGVATAYLLARRGRLSRWLDPVFMLPLATSAVTLGFGYILTLNRMIDTRLLIPLMHTLVALPFVVRSVLPAIRSINPYLLEAARSLGATPARVWWRVELPLISRGVIVGATFAFTMSLGEFGASLFLARPDTPTIPVVIFRLLNQPGVSNYGQALAMSVILMGVCALSFIIIERLRKAGVGEF